MKTLLFLLGIVVVGVVGFILERKSYRVDGVGFFLCFISIFVLIVALISLPISRIGYKTQVIEYREFIETIKEARLDDIDNIERTNITIKIAEWNGWLAKSRYKNETILDWYVPDKIMELEPIR